MKDKDRTVSRSSRIIFIDKWSVITKLSPKALETIGVEAKTLVGLVMKSVLPSEQESRKKELDQIVSEKETLLVELRHRIYNSLQIISSLLLIQAKKIQSEEVRLHIQHAHLRIKALAEMTDQLAVNSTQDVDIIQYLTCLCKTIDESLIDGRPVTLAVSGHCDTAVPNDKAVSYGLIVTELVINSLKYAFSDDTKGAINVIFDGVGTDWKLSVEDDGVGCPLEVLPGLGSQVIKSLARQLDARVELTHKSQGTCITLIHP